MSDHSTYYDDVREMFFIVLGLLQLCSAVFGDFKVDDAVDAVTNKKSPYPMSNESKFKFSSFTSPFARGKLHQGHFTLSQISFYEFEQHLNETTNVVFT